MLRAILKGDFHRLCDTFPWPGPYDRAGSHILCPNPRFYRN